MRYELPEGCKVKYHHVRDYDPSTGVFLNPKGGTTLAVVLDDRGFPIAQGLARCSRRDNYRKAIGRQIALGRALKSLSERSSWNL